MKEKKTCVNCGKTYPYPKEHQFSDEYFCSQKCGYKYGLKMINEEYTKPQIIESEEGNDFLNYIFQNGKHVPAGTPVGVEVINPRTKKWEMKLFEDIFFP